MFLLAPVEVEGYPARIEGRMWEWCVAGRCQPQPGERQEVVLAVE